MAFDAFPRVLRGYDPGAVDQELEKLTGELETMRAELASMRSELTETLETNTNLRLTVVKQVEEASAEAAVVLGHARSEATRIRELAVEESDAVIEGAKEAKDLMIHEAEQIRADALAQLESHKASAEEMKNRAEREAAEILAAASAKADALIADAEASKEESQKKIREMENDIRMQKLELDRIETDTREKADAYAMRVYREADEYAKSSERRALDLEKQAEEILAQARVSAHDQTTRSLQTARRYLEDALGLVNGIFSDVNGSLLEVQRIRQVLGDSVDRIVQVELQEIAPTAEADKKVPAQSDADESEDDD